MAFTITCDHCGGEQTFTQTSKMSEDRIRFDIYMTGTYEPYPQDMTISCENPSCWAEATIRC